MNETDIERSTHFGSPDGAFRAWKRDATHIARFMQVVQEPASPERTQALEDLYLIRSDRTLIWELIGIRMRGHPSVILGAVDLPRYDDPKPRQGRTLIAQFLSKPPRAPAVKGVSSPVGLLRVAVPHLDESIDEFFARLRAAPTFGPVLHLDPELIDFAFDFRPGNPVEQEHLKPPPGNDNVSALRTIDGHVLTATGHGLYLTLQRDSLFVTLTDVVQHTPQRTYRLPTLSFNRKYLALERQIGNGEENALNTLAFHPVTAKKGHLFGVACEEIMG